MMPAKVLNRNEIFEGIKILEEEHPEGVTSSQLHEAFFKEKASAQALRPILLNMVRKDLLSRDIKYGEGSSWSYVYKTKVRDLSPPLDSQDNNERLSPHTDSPATRANTESKLPQPPIDGASQKPVLLIDDVLSALETACQASLQGVSASDLHQKFFPQHPAEMVRQLLNYLDQEGRVSHSMGGQANRAKLYYPSWVWPQKSKAPEKAPAPIQEYPDKTLGFRCLVCRAIVGVKAQEGTFLLDCNACSTDYVIHKGVAYRLGEGVKIQVWAPVPDQVLR